MPPGGLLRPPTARRASLVGGLMQLKAILARSGTRISADQCHLKRIDSLTL